eukprot:357190-Chlamydomonas_euryale.AAC.1
MRVEGQLPCQTAGAHQCVRSWCPPVECEKQTSAQCGRVSWLITVTPCDGNRWQPDVVEQPQ